MRASGPAEGGGVLALLSSDRAGARASLTTHPLFFFSSRRLPGIQNPPSREAIRKALLAFDSNRDGVLDKREFVSFIQNVVTLGPDKFLKNLAVNTGVLPAAAVALKKLSGTGLANYIPALAQMAGIPPVILAPLVGVVRQVWGWGGGGGG